jgi:hypothetical protein
VPGCLIQARGWEGEAPSHLLLTEAERSEIRRVKVEVVTLLREDEERRRRGEGNVRDECEVFENTRGRTGPKGEREALTWCVQSM